jgi:hypothetical protein
VIIVVASRHDQGARALVTRLGTDSAALLTPGDLSLPGWRHYLAAAGASAAVIGGRKIALEEVTGVVTCLPSVSELEILHIAPADRAYVAAEMTAFLLSWLSTLRCPVVNRPSPTCLSGPYWRPEEWTYVASQVGMHVQPVHRRVAFPADAAPAVTESITVTVVGERCLGQADTTVMTGAQRLARAANVELLAVRVSDPGPDATFLGADLWLDLTSEETANEVLEYIGQRASLQVPRPSLPSPALAESSNGAGSGRSSSGTATLSGVDHGLAAVIGMEGPAVSEVEVASAW